MIKLRAIVLLLILFSFMSNITSVTTREEVIWIFSEGGRFKIENMTDIKQLFRSDYDGGTIGTAWNFSISVDLNSSSSVYFDTSIEEFGIGILFLIWISKKDKFQNFINN